MNLLSTYRRKALLGLGLSLCTALALVLAAPAGAGPAVYPLTGSGGASVVDAGVGADGWITALDCDLTAQIPDGGTIVLSPDGGDGVTTFCGLNWTKSGSIYEITPMTLGPTGLTVTPVQASLYFNSDHIPALRFPLSAVIPATAYYLGTPVRISTAVGSSNPAAAFDLSVMGMDNVVDSLSGVGVPSMQLVAGQGFYNNMNTGFVQFGQNLGLTQGTFTIADKTMQLTSFDGLWFERVIVGRGTFSSGWPAFTNIWSVGVAPNFNGAFPGNVGNASSWTYIVGAERNGSLTAFVVVFTHVRIEYRAR